MGSLGAGVELQARSRVPEAGDDRVGYSVPLLVLSAFLLVGVLLAGALHYLRGEALVAGQRLTQSLAQVIAEQSSRTLQTIDLRLQLAASDLDGLDSRKALTESSARELLRRELADIPAARAMWVLDAQGRIALDSDVGNIGTSLADRAYFTVHRDAPDAGFHVGPLVRSRSTGTWLMSASRPLFTPSGQWRGVIAAAVLPEYFEQLWRGIDVGNGTAVTLFHRSGQLMVRSPADEAAMGRDFSQDPLFGRLLARERAGTAPRPAVTRIQSPIDGRERIAAARALPGYPDLLVVVGSDYESVLAPWQRLMTLALAVWAVAAVAAFSLALQLRVQRVRRLSTERRVLQLAQAMPQIVFMSNRKGEAEFINERWTEATGSPAAAALGTGWLDRVHPDDRSSAVASMTRVMRTGQTVENEHRILYRDGIYRWQLLRAVPNRNRAGEVVSWCGTSTEIHAQKRAQEILRRQAEALALAGRLARLGAWRLDVPSMTFMFDAQAAALVDLEPDTAIPASQVLTIVAPESLEASERALRDVLAEGRPFDVQVKINTPKGRTVWLRSLAQAVYDAAGQVVAVQGAQQDITDRVQLIEQIQMLNASLEEKVAQRTSELAMQEALFQTLAENAPSAIWTVDPRGAVTFLSRAWYDMTGGAPPQFHGYDWLGVMHPDDLPGMQQDWVRSAKAGTPHAGTRKILSKNGTYRTTTYRAIPMRDKQGAITFWVGVDTDITEIVASEAALRLANEQLTAFSYSVSHDLRSPVQRVAMFAQLLESELGPDAAGKARHYLARIRANADQMAQLIDGMLALAQMSELDMVRGDVNVSEVAAEVMDRLHSAEPARRVHWHIEPGLRVQGDVRMVRSVMDNLLGNAWKFTGREPQPEIVVESGSEPGSIRVRDNGAGFDMAYADKLFGTFQRLHREDEFPGTGIGLATVARAVSRHGGRIWAEAEVGKGATFTFTMPAPA